MRANVPKMNFHTHTTYCDGKESAESMILVALDKGFTRLGFSGHSYTAYDESYCMPKADVPKYMAEVRALAEKYQDRIEILCGVEQDFGSKYPVDAFDYAIGSVHCVEKDGEYYCVDDTAEVLAQGIREGFGGDVYALVKTFFSHEAEVIDRTHADFVGHFDLVTKFNEGNRFFDPMDRRVKNAALEAMEALLEKDVPFEINTGAMYKKLRTEPYPSVYLLKELFRRKGSIMLSSDSHDGASIGYAFPEMAQLVKDIGFRTLKVRTKTGFEDFVL